MIHWAKDFIGIPFRFEGRDRTGADCYGLVMMVHREVLGYSIPDYLGYGPEPGPEDLAPRFKEAEEGGDWRKVETPMVGDVVSLRRFGLPLHCGVCLGGGHMLHSMEATGSIVESFTSLAWRDKVLGFFRFGATG